MLVKLAAALYKTHIHTTDQFIHFTLHALKRIPTGLRVKLRSELPSHSTDSSNSEHILATTANNSARANDWPIQFCFPIEKGMNESFISCVGFSHLDGR